MSTAASVECSQCGTGNRPQARFCGSCGAPLAAEVTCPRCGARNPGSQCFCDGCGSELGARSQPEGAPASPRTLADGRYTLGRLLGEGAGKRVYLATDTRLQREVAAAVFKAAGSDETAMRRARREAEAMAPVRCQRGQQQLRRMEMRHGEYICRPTRDARGR